MSKFDKIAPMKEQGLIFGSLTPRDKLHDHATGVIWLYKEEGWLSRVDEREPDECWDWKGANHRQGYGLYVIRRIGEKTGDGPMNAQRFALARHLGRPLKKEERVSATCHNVRCTNPKHLFITDYRGQFKNSGQKLSGGGHEKKYLPDFFEQHFDDLVLLGPLAMSKKLNMTEGECSSAKYAFKVWMKKEGRTIPSKFDTLMTEEFMLANLEAFTTYSINQLAKHLRCTPKKAKLASERFDQFINGNL